MSLLKAAIVGRQKLPVLMVLYGVDGIGKSTFAAGAPDPFYIDPEKGSRSLDVARATNTDTWESVTQWLNALLTDPHSHKTLVIDSIDHLEHMLHRSICAKYSVATVELAAGGYGKGHSEAFNEWAKFLDLLAAIRDKRGMNIILIAHSQVVQFNDPTTEVAYFRYELKLHESKAVSVRALFREKVDMVLFANYVVYSKGEGKEARGLSERVRKIWTERSASHDAKNRFDLPYELPFPKDGAYDLVMSAIEKAAPKSEKEVNEEIERLLKLVPDAALIAKVRENMKGANSILLGKILAKLKGVTNGTQAG